MRGGARSAGVTLETRRRFLKNSALATAGLARASVFDVSPVAPLEAAPASTAPPGHR